MNGVLVDSASGSGAVAADRGLQRALSRLRSPVVLLTVLFVLSVPLITPYLRGDGVGYYAWLRSAVVDHDLQFEDEYQHGDPAFVRNTFDANGQLRPQMRTVTGHARNQWFTGAAVVWSPFFLLAHGIVLTERLIHRGPPADGYSLPYRWLTAFGTALSAFLGLLLSYRVALSFSRPSAALLGTIAVWGASSLAIYAYFLPFWPFGDGVLVAALLLAVWRREYSTSRWLVMGVLSGLVVSIHPVASAWLILPAVSLARLRASRFQERATALAALGGGTVLGALPFLIGKTVVQGSPLSTGYGDDTAKMDFLHPRVLEMLFGTGHGLILWTPVAGLALLGLMWISLRRDRRLGLSLLAVFVVMLYLVSSESTPMESSFGNRFFVLFVPGLVIGAGGLAELALTKARAAIVPAVMVLVLWNSLLAFQWAWGMVPKRGDACWSQVLSNQFYRAPVEMAGAARLFVFDRNKLLTQIQEKDLQQLNSGADRAHGTCAATAV